MKARVQQIAAQALRSLGAIRETATYTHKINSEYDVTTSTVTEITDTFSVPVVFTDYNRYERRLNPGKIDVKDRKALILPSDMGEITPTFEDTLTRANGDAYRIVEGGIGLDPAEALYVLQVRECNRGG